MYRVELIYEAQEDLAVLPKDILHEVKDYLYKFQNDPYKYSKKLYNQGGLNLKGYRKTYLADATYRIVLKIEDDIIKVVEVVSIGKREDKEVYREAHIRIHTSQ